VILKQKHHVEGTGIPFVSRGIGLILWILNAILPKSKSVYVFNSLYGNQYSDSPKVLYENMKNDSYFDNAKFFWVFIDENLVSGMDTSRVLKKNSIKYIWYMLRAKYWISNSDIERFYGTRIPSRGHVYVNTWHGVPVKYLGEDERSIVPGTKDWFKNVRFTLLTATSQYDKKIFNHIFPNTNQDNIVTTGLPRNDWLRYVHHEGLESKLQKQIKEKLDIPQDKKVILYAPTYRDYEVNDRGRGSDDIMAGLSIPEDLPNDFVILVRGHYFNKWDKKQKQQRIINVSDYPNINELYVLADVLISDYSSVIFDYAILEKPIYLYLYDLEKYEEARGLYRKPNELGLPTYYDWDVLIHKIVEGHGMEKRNKIISFNQEYNSSENESATKKVISLIKKL